MRVLLVTSAFPPMIGGPSRQAVEIIRGLIERGHEVIALTTAPVTDEFPAIQIPQHQGNGPKAKLIRYIQLITSLTSTIITFRPHIIHNQVFGGPLSILSCLIARLLNYPALTKFTGERALEQAGERDWANKGIKGKFFLSLARSFDHIQIQLSNYIWSTSTSFTLRLTNIYNLPERRILTYPNFTDTRPFEEIARRHRKKEHLRKILTVCRLRPWKGLSDGLQALATLKNPYLHWTIVGDGKEEYRKQLYNEISKLKLNQQVTLAGPVDPYNIKEAYKDADFFLLPSRYEPFGIVLIEAMASGLPIIATRTGGIPYVLGRPTAGILVEPFSPDAIAHAIQHLTNNNNINRYRIQAIARAKFFSLPRGISNILRFYFYSTKLNSSYYI